jgi:hypothetical protein
VDKPRAVAWVSARGWMKAERCEVYLGAFVGHAVRERFRDVCLCPLAAALPTHVLSIPSVPHQKELHPQWQRFL